jgi:threonine/homoserine/homoserine lactone efflux protein
MAHNAREDIMIIKGFCFGMLLQLAVGPMCLMVFHTSASNGVLNALILVSSITLIDTLYIALSGFGIAAVLNKKKVRYAIKLFGCLILVLFGTSTITGALGMSLLPSIELFDSTGVQNIFLKGLLLTASNPLTIIFWSGVFSTQVVQHQLNRRQLFFFGFGCVLSTLSFLSLIAILGSVISGFLPELVITGLNIIIGCLLVFFGIRLVIRKEKN